MNWVSVVEISDITIEHLDYDFGSQLNVSDNLIIVTRIIYKQNIVIDWD